VATAVCEQGAEMIRAADYFPSLLLPPQPPQPQTAPRHRGDVGPDDGGDEAEGDARERDGGAGLAENGPPMPNRLSSPSAIQVKIAARQEAMARIPRACTSRGHVGAPGASSPRHCGGSPQGWRIVNPCTTAVMPAP
jgi:hypothetical protein